MWYQVWHTSKSWCSKLHICDICIIYVIYYIHMWYGGITYICDMITYVCDMRGVCMTDISYQRYIGASIKVIFSNMIIYIYNTYIVSNVSNT